MEVAVPSTPHPFPARLVSDASGAIGGAFESGASLQLENIGLRHQIAILQRSARKRPRLNPADRALWVWLSGVWHDWRSALVMVKPETVIAWHHTGFRLFWTWKVNRVAGMRESEAFALRCGDVGNDGIRIERSFYKGKFEAPKTPKSERMVGVPDEILVRLRTWISKLTAQASEDCVFPPRILLLRFGRRACCVYMSARCFGPRVWAGLTSPFCGVRIPLCTSKGTRT